MNQVSKVDKDIRVMKVGLLAYSSNTGLGYQTRHFYEHIGADKVLISDLSKHNQMPVDHSWCKKPRICDGIPKNEDVEWLVDGMDLVFVCETPLNFHLFKYARQKGVKTVLQYNYEFLHYLKYRNDHPPDVLASPSYWNIPAVEKLGIAPVKYLPVPIDVSRIPYRQIDKVETLVHIAGRPAALDRNGTRLFLDLAMKYKDKYKYKLYYQEPRDGGGKEIFAALKHRIESVNIQLGDIFEIITDVEDNTEMYASGDVLILPRRYGGLCLPLWEALSAGMPVIMTDISPNDQVLPKSWLVKADVYQFLKTRTMIPVFDARLESFAGPLGYIERNIERCSREAREMAEMMSWSNRKRFYLELFKETCES